MSATLALSVSGVTARTAAVAALALVALLLTGWRKPARAEPRSPRGRPEAQVGGVAVEHHDAPLHRRPGPVRRLLALAASGGIGLLTGVLLAIVIAFVTAAAVVWLTNLLGG